jgi:CDP-diacylglycerol--serine O-phosphatidyltransferase
MNERARRRHFSMLRGFHLADLFTIANGFCGVAAVFQAMTFLATQNRRNLYLAALLVPLALVMDVLDGRIARWRHQASEMGRELDSLADVISFGVAPAAIAFAAGLDRPLDQLALMYFVGCGLSRLARYNITAGEGTPIPTSVVPLGLLMLAFHHGDLYPVTIAGLRFHLVTLLFVVSGSLMISKTLRIPKP